VHPRGNMAPGDAHSAEIARPMWVASAGNVLPRSAAASGPEVRRCTTTAQSCGRWCALSHCWSQPRGVTCHGPVSWVLRRGGGAPAEESWPQAKQAVQTWRARCRLQVLGASGPEVRQLLVQKCGAVLQPRRVAGVGAQCHTSGHYSGERRHVGAVRPCSPPPSFMDLLPPYLSNFAA
jgi:hypothetical protein